MCFLISFLVGLIQFFYDLSSPANFYSFSVDIIALTLFGRFTHFMHVYFMQSWYFENSNVDIGAILRKPKTFGF